MKSKKHGTISLDPRVIDDLREIAEEESRSMASQVKHWVEQHKRRNLHERAS